MSRNADWPEGVLKLVSREAYDATRRGRAFGSMAPMARLEAALSYDELFGLEPDAPVAERLAALDALEGEVTK